MFFIASKRWRDKIIPQDRLFTFNRFSDGLQNVGSLIQCSSQSYGVHCSLRFLRVLGLDVVENLFGSPVFWSEVMFSAQSGSLKSSGS